LLGLLALGLTMPACATTVIGGSGEGSGGSGGSTPTSSPNAVAMRFSHWTQPVISLGSPFEFSPTIQVDPDALVLFFSDKPQACAQPFVPLDDPSLDPAVCAEQAAWQTIIILPPDRAQPGAIDLDDQSIFVYRSTWMASCGGGSGNTPGVPGTLTIESLDATAAAVDLELDQPPGDGFVTQNGAYTAALCP
jgi:hypothetical protein